MYWIWITDLKKRIINTKKVIEGFTQPKGMSITVRKMGPIREGKRSTVRKLVLQGTEVTLTVESR